MRRASIASGLAAGLGLALAAIACSDPIPPAAPTPVPASISETFTGTLLVGSTNYHQFKVNQAGELKASLTGIDPPAAVHISVGTPSQATASCVPIAGMNVVAGPSAQLTGTATIAGQFCVSIADAGNLVEPVMYTITVVHS